MRDMFRILDKEKRGEVNTDELRYASYAQYTPPTPTGRNCFVASASRRRRCEHEFATSWRQFRRVVGVNTPVGSRDPVYNFLC